jgi:hypothetical protein
LSQPEPEAVRPADGARTYPRHGWRRRQFLVDAQYQLRSGVLAGTVAIILLVLLNTALVLQQGESSPGSEGTGLGRPSISIQDRSSLVIMLIGSAVFFGGVVLVSVLESHRTAGAAFAIRRAVDAMRGGETQIRVRLRRGDHLQELARSINLLAETLDAERLRRD